MAWWSASGAIADSLYMSKNSIHPIERRWYVERIAARWVGTPFVPHAARRGEGVDCVHLVGEILREAGVISHYQFPGYRCDAGSHNAESQVVAWLDVSHDFRLLPAVPQATGDLLVFRVGRCAHHVGLSVGPARFIHAIRGRGAIVSSVRDSTYAKRLLAIYRPTVLMEEVTT